MLAVALLAESVELWALGRAPVQKRAEHGFWVHDGLFWDTGCTCKLLQGHTCARRATSGATLPTAALGSGGLAAGIHHSSTTPSDCNREDGSLAGSSRLVAATRSMGGQAPV